MVICRVQQSPYENERVYKAIESSLAFRTQVSTFRQITREIAFYSDVLPLVLGYLHQPLFLGFISMLLRCIPLEDTSSAEDAKISGIDKEVQAVTGWNRPQVLDYSCLFGPHDQVDKPLHPMIPARPELALMMRYRLSAWKVGSMFYGEE